LSNPIVHVFFFKILNPPVKTFVIGQADLELSS
jgi:hypothetical protein